MVENYNNNYYTEAQIDAINNIKSRYDSYTKKTDEKQGDRASIFDDIEAYKNNGEVNEKNSELFEYIEDMMGFDNFYALLDDNSDDIIDFTEINSLLKLDGDDTFSSKDINLFAEKISDIQNASVNKNGEKRIYKQDSDGQLKESNEGLEFEHNGKTYHTKKDENGRLTLVDENGKKAGDDIYNAFYKNVNDASIEKTEKQNQKTDKKNPLGIDVNNPSLKIEYNDDKSIKSMVDEFGNKTVYSYDSNGKLTSSKKYLGDSENNDSLMNECTYNDKNLIETQHEYISEETGTRGEYFHTYTYDNNGRLATSTVYKGGSATGEPIGEYEYLYTLNSSTPYGRFNKATNLTEEDSLDNDGKRISTTFKDSLGNVVKINTYNDDGTIKSTQENGITYTNEYSDGMLTKSTGTDSNGETANISYFQNGRITARTEGDITYIFEYDNETGEVKTLKYNSTDCTNGVANAGTNPISVNNIGQVSYDKLNGVMDMQLGQELAELALANNRNTHMHCLSGVIDTLAAKWGRLWEDAGIRPSVAADSFANMDDPNDPIGQHFKEVEGVSVDELTSLPAGCIVVWDYNFPGSQGMGHITVTMGDGTELSDHHCDMYLDYNTAYKVYCPVG